MDPSPRPAPPIDATRGIDTIRGGEGDAPPPPPTIIVVHPKEKRSKCTVEPLRGQEGFRFWKYPSRGDESLAGYVRVGLGGPLLTPAHRDIGLLFLDATWNLAGRMSADFAELPVYSLEPWETAYPRTSKLFEDPSGGLATIEAIYAAYVQIGRNPAGLLDHYRWRDDFLSRNSARLETPR
jgi:pre-rRNA-processing protein TSR3